MAKVAELDTGEIKVRSIDTNKLHPNPWNPNRMDEATLKAERESIATFGFIDPCTVRPLKGKRGHFQIIDGEHRWKVATEEKRKQVPCTVLDLSDTAAKKLTIVLNETRGQADTALLSSLLNELQGELGDDLGIGLRWSDRELGSILAVDNDDWQGYDPDGLNEVSFTTWDGFSMQVRAPKAFDDVWERALEKADHSIQLDPDKRVANGQVVMLAVEAYLKR